MKVFSAFRDANIKIMIVFIKESWRKYRFIGIKRGKVTYNEDGSILKIEAEDKEGVGTSFEYTLKKCGLRLMENKWPKRYTYATH